MGSITQDSELMALGHHTYTTHSAVLLLTPGGRKLEPARVSDSLPAAQVGPLSQKLWTPSPSTGPHLFLLVLLNQWLGVTRKLVNRRRFLGYLLRDSNKRDSCGCCIVSKHLGY